MQKDVQVEQEDVSMNSSSAIFRCAAAHIVYACGCILLGARCKLDMYADSCVCHYVHGCCACIDESKSEIEKELGLLTRRWGKNMEVLGVQYQGIHTHARTHARAHTL